MKKLFILAVFSAIGLMAHGQKLLLDGNKAMDNWSFGVRAGAVTPLKHHAFLPNMRPTFGLELGKQLTPIIGIGIEGMAAVNTTSSRTAIDYLNMSLLGKVNLSNLFGGYHGQPRTFEIEAVGGIGALHLYRSGAEDPDYLSSKAGLNFNFNLGAEKAWTFAIKPALLYNMEGLGTSGVRYNANRANFELTAGLIYHFMNSNGKRYMTLERAFDQGEIDDLNAKINDMRGRAENAESSLDDANRRIKDLQNQLDDCRNQKPAVVTKNEGCMESIVTFRQGKTVIDKSQMPNVERIAVYLENHPSATVVIKGYASPEGGAKINEKLANQRAEVVKSLLVKKYKISEDRISASGQGVGNMFSEPSWNRVSICTLDEGDK